MNETQIECFLAAAESESLTRAARKLFRSPQSLHRHIANLEKELDCQLFDRDSRGSSLTPAGEKYYHFFLSARCQMKHTINTIQHLYDVMKLNFRIGISTWLDPFGRIYDSIENFIRLHPSTTFEIIYLSNYDLFARIRERSLDTAIVCDSQVSLQQDIHIERFAPEDLRLFISRQLLESGETGYTLCDSAYGAWSQPQWAATSQRLSHRHISYEPATVIHMPNLQSALINVENGCAMAVCDSNFGSLSCNDSGLHNVSINMVSSLACVWNKRNENPLILEFLDTLKNDYQK